MQFRQKIYSWYWSSQSNKRNNKKFQKNIHGPNHCNTVNIVDELRTITNYFTGNLGVKKAINSHSIKKEINVHNGCREIM